MGKKKLVIITPNRLPVPALLGGAVEGLIDSFIKEITVGKNFDILIIGVVARQVYSRPEGVRFLSLAPRFMGAEIFNKLQALCFHFAWLKYFHFLSFSRYSRYLREADIILVENNIFVLPYLCSRYCDKIVYRAHNDYFSPLYDSIWQTIKASPFRLVGVSDYVCAKAQTKLTNLRDLVVIHNGIEEFLFSRKSFRCIRDTFGIKKSSVVLTYVGRLVKSKGVESLIQVFNEYSIKGVNVDLLLIGALSFKNSDIPQGLIDRSSVNTRIHFVGYVNRTELHNYYKSSDLVIVPSLEPEAFGLVKLEALACGVPVVITDNGGLAECLPDEGGYSLIETSNAQKELRSILNEVTRGDSLYLRSLKSKAKGATVRSSRNMNNDFHEYLISL